MAPLVHDCESTPDTGRCAKLWARGKSTVEVFGPLRGTKKLLPAVRRLWLEPPGSQTAAPVRLLAGRDHEAQPGAAAEGKRNREQTRRAMLAASSSKPATGD